MRQRISHQIKWKEKNKIEKDSSLTKNKNDFVDHFLAGTSKVMRTNRYGFGFINANKK